MASHLKKYAAALVSARDYVAQRSADLMYADEALIVPFPTLAIFDPDKQVWLIQIKAWLYLPFEGKKIKSYLPSLPSFFAGGRKQEEQTEPSIDEDKKLAAAIAIEENDQQAELIDDDMCEDALQELEGANENPGRLGFFFVGSSVNVITKSIINGIEYLLPPSDESGFIEEELEFPDYEIQPLGTIIHPQSDDRKFDYEIQLNQSKSDVNHQTFKCTIYVLALSGVSVISDIDDTIKITKVLCKRALLKNTFYSYFQPVDGMNELYQKWAEQKCQFHYVSASPWQLYPALRSFLEKYQYPMGTMNLRKFKWSRKFIKPPDTYKIETLTQIIRSYPFRKYICVGDSGELDPEIYSKLYTLYPDNIAHIFIRDICQLSECLPSCQERYKKAFADIPEERWTIFKDPRVIQTNIENLIAV